MENQNYKSKEFDRENFWKRKLCNKLPPAKKKEIILFFNKKMQNKKISNDKDILEVILKEIVQKSFNISISEKALKFNFINPNQKIKKEISNIQDLKNIEIPFCLKLLIFNNLLYLKNLIVVNYNFEIIENLKNSFEKEIFENFKNSKKENFEFLKNIEYVENYLAIDYSNENGIKILKKMIKKNIFINEFFFEGINLTELEEFFYKNLKCTLKYVIEDCKIIFKIIHENLIEDLTINFMSCKKTISTGKLIRLSRLKLIKILFPSKVFNNIINNFFFKRDKKIIYRYIKKNAKSFSELEIAKFEKFFENQKIVYKIQKIFEDQNLDYLKILLEFEIKNYNYLNENKKKTDFDRNFSLLKLLEKKYEDFFRLILIELKKKNY